MAVRDETVLPELDAEEQRSSEPHNTALLHDASRMWVPREPFGVASVTPLQHGQQTVNTPDVGSAPALLLSQLARCAGVTGKTKPSERSCTGGAARGDSTVRRTNLAILACGNSRQHEFANTRSVKQLSLPLQEPYFIALTIDFTHFQGLSTLPFLKGELRSMIGTQRIDSVASLDIRSTDNPATGRSRLRLMNHGFGSPDGPTTGRGRTRHIFPGVQQNGVAELKNNNAQIRNLYTHALTSIDTVEVKLLPSALRNRNIGQTNLRLRVPKQNGRANELDSVKSSECQLRLSERLIEGRRRRDRLKFVAQKVNKPNEMKRNDERWKRRIIRRHIVKPFIPHLSREAGNWYIVLIISKSCFSKDLRGGVLARYRPRARSVRRMLTYIELS